MTMRTRRSLVISAIVPVLLLPFASQASAQLAEFRTVPSESDFLALLAPRDEGEAGFRHLSGSPVFREIREEPALPGVPRQPSASPTRPPRRPQSPARVPAAITMPDAFALNSVELPPRTIAMLDNLAAAMRQVPESVVLITGHTDSTGLAAYNEVLSRRRAEAAFRHLTERHRLDGQRIDVAGFGSRRPIAGLHPSVPENRRIQIWAQRDSR